MNLDLHLAQLEASALIRLDQLHPDREYVFRHVLIQEAAYGSLLRVERRRVHQSVAETLERAFPERLNELAPLLARHFDEAGDRERAIHYFALAGEMALRIYANAEAVLHYTRAVELVEPKTAEAEQLHRLYAARGRALELTGQFERALSNYEAMEALALERGDRPLELAALTARTTLRATPTPLFDPAQGKPLAEHTLALAHALGDRAAEASILWNLMLLHYYIGELPQAMAYGEQSLAIAQALDLRPQLALTRHNLANAYLAAGQTERGRQMLAEVEQMWRELDNQHMLAESLLLSGRTLFMLGDYESAHPSLQAACALSREVHNLWIESCCDWVLGSLSAERGDMGAAIQTFEATMAAAQTGGFGLMEAIGRAELGWLYGRLGDVPQGLAVTDAVSAGAKSGGWPPEFRAWVTAMLASLQILGGDLAQAEATLAEGAAGFDRRNLSTPAPIIVGWAEAELALARGRPESVGVIVAELTTLLLTAGLKTYLPHTLLLQGRALLAMGQVDGAQTVLSEAHTLAEAIGMRHEAWLILEVQCGLAARRGDLAGAQALSQRAREHFDYIAGRITAPELRAAFLKQHQVRASPGSEAGASIDWGQ